MIVIISYMRKHILANSAEKLLLTFCQEPGGLAYLLAVLNGYRGDEDEDNHDHAHQQHQPQLDRRTLLDLSTQTLSHVLVRSTDSVRQFLLGQDSYLKSLVRLIRVFARPQTNLASARLTNILNAVSSLIQRQLTAASDTDLYVSRSVLNYTRNLLKE